MNAYAVYSTLASGDTDVDLSPLFLTPGVANPSYLNLSWQLAIQDEGYVIWSGEVNPDGSLAQGTAPDNFILTDSFLRGYPCNSRPELQIKINPPPNKPCKCPGQGSCPAGGTSGNSVELATGNFVFEKELLSIAGVGSGGWSFDLNYNSNFDIDGILGKNFAYPQFMHLEQLTGGYLFQNDVLLVTSQLSRVIFNNDGSGNFSSAPNNTSGAKLTVTNQFQFDEYYTLTDANGTVTTFYGFNYFNREGTSGGNITNPAPGQIQSIVDRFENSQEFVWGNSNKYSYYDPDYSVHYYTVYGGLPQLQSVTDSYGRVVNYSYYDEEGGYRLQQITDYLGRQLDFQYDDDDHLVAVVTPSILKAAPGNTFPGGSAYVFQYDVNNSNPARRDDLIRIWYPNQTQAYLDVATRTVDVGAVYANATARYQITYGQNVGDADTFGKVLTETLGDPINEVGGTATFAYLTLDPSAVENPFDPFVLPPSGPVPDPPYSVAGGTPIINRTIYTDRNGNRTIYDFNGTAVYNSVETSPDVYEWDLSITPNWAVTRMEEQLNRSKNSLETTPVSTPPNASPFVTWTEFNVQNQPLVIVYPEGNSVEYIYDTGNIPADGDESSFFWVARQGLKLSETRLPGNSIGIASRPVGDGPAFLTKRYFYDPLFNQLCAVIDERGNPITTGSTPYFAPQNGGTTPTDADRSRYATIYTFDYQKDTVDQLTSDPVLLELLGLTTETSWQIQSLIDYVNGQMTATDGTGGIPVGFPMGLGDVNGDGTGNGADSGLPDATHLGNVIMITHPSVLLVGGTTQERIELFTVNLLGQVTTATDPEGNLTVTTRYPENDPEGTGQFISSTLSTQQYGLVREVHVDANPDDVMSLVGASGDLVDFFPGIITRTNTPGVYQDLVTRYEGSSGCMTCAYDAMGNVLSQTDPRGFTTVYDRNEMGEVYRVTSPAPYNFKVETSYDANRNVIQVDTEDWQVQYNSPDPTSPGYGTFTPSGSGTTAHVPMIPGPGGALRLGWFSNLMSYDILDNKIQDDIDATGSTPANLITQYQYDANQNLQRIIKPEGNTVEFDYDERDLKIADRVGFDAASGQPGSVTAYSYDGNKNLINVIGPVNHNYGYGTAATTYLTVYIADGFGSGFMVTAVGDWVVENTYDGFDRVITKTDARGGVETLTYDPISNVIGKQFAGTLTNTEVIYRDSSSNVLLTNSEMRYDEAGRLYENQRDVFLAAGTSLARVVTHTGGGLTANDLGYVEPYVSPATLTSGQKSYILTRNINDRSGRIIAKLADNTAQTSYEFDGAGRQIFVTDPLNNTTATGYDGNGNPVQVTKADVSTITTPTVADEVFISFTWFDCLNRPVVAGTQGSDGNLTANLNLCCPWQGLPSTLFSLTCYDSRGNQATVTDPKLNVLVSIFDGASRLTETQQEMRLNGDGRCGPASNQTFLTAGGSIIRTEYLYDANSRLVELVDDRGASTLYAYDALDRLVTKTLADGSVSTRVYDLANCLLTYTDENGTVLDSSEYNCYDALSNRLQLNINRATGVGGTSSQSFQYDGLSRVGTAYDFPVYTSSVSRGYDSLGRLLEEQVYRYGFGDTRYTSFTKWASLVATQLTYPSGNIAAERIYDALYRCKSLKGGTLTDGVIGTAFDTVDWQFFGSSRIVESNYGSGSLISTQMNNARTHSTVQPAVALPPWGSISTDQIGYDGVGRMITKRYMTGGISGSTNGYENTTALVGYTTAYDRAGNKLFERHLEAESRSHLYQPFNSDGSFGVGYDSAYRLLQYKRGVLSSATIPYRVNPGASITTPITLPGTNQVRTYGLDGLGNWKTGSFTAVGSEDGTSMTSEVRQHNYVNELLKLRDTTGGTTTTTPFTYDYGNNSDNPLQGNGNIINDGVRIYQYDALNRLIQINSAASPDTVWVTYAYDAFNRRIQKSVTNGGVTGDIPDVTINYMYAGDQIIQEIDTGGASLKANFWGQYVDELMFFTVPTATTYRVLSDLLYRSVAIVTTGNVIAEAYDTDAYGNTLCFSRPGTGTGPDDNWFADDAVTTDNPINSTIFTGRQYDPESQIYYYRARYYSPSIGRFISRDPIGVKDGMNLYAYVGNNPINHTDPLGLMRDCSAEYNDCMITCMGKKSPWSWENCDIPPRQNKWGRYKFCENICQAAYMECDAENAAEEAADQMANYCLQHPLLCVGGVAAALLLVPVLAPVGL